MYWNKPKAKQTAIYGSDGELVGWLHQILETFAKQSDIPSVSLPEKICYRTKFRSVATDWGCEHEVVKCQYTNLMKNTPSNFLVVDAGSSLWRNTNKIFNCVMLLIWWPCKATCSKITWSFRGSLVDVIITGVLHTRCSVSLKIFWMQLFLIY